MTGTLRVSNKKEKKEKHDHFILQLSSKYILKYNDPRKFGMIFFSEESPISSNKLFNNLGLEPLSKKFNAEYLYKISRNRNVAIKSFLMNSNIVVGIGNIYASESLFLAEIKPNNNPIVDPFEKLPNPIIKTPTDATKIAIQTLVVIFSFKNKNPNSAVTKGIADKHKSVIAAVVLVIDQMKEIIAHPRPNPPIRPE